MVKNLIPMSNYAKLSDKELLEALKEAEKKNKEAKKRKKAKRMSIIEKCFKLISVFFTTN